MSDTLRLLFVTHSFPPEENPQANIGGMQRVACDLYHALQKHPGVALKSLALRTAWKTTALKMPAYFARTYREIGRMVENRDIDVVLFSSMVTASMVPFLKNRLKMNAVHAMSIAHGLDITWPYALYQKHVHQVLGLLDGAFPVSRHTKIECLRRGAPEHRLHILPNGIDPHRFNRYKNAPDVRRAMCAVFGHALPENALLLCSLGRLVARKGFAWFVDAVMPRLPEHIHYWIGGQGTETPSIQAAINRHGLSRRVRLLGLVPEQHLELLYRGSDLFVMPNIPQDNDVEGFGVVMLEAGICGLPTLAANLEGIRDVIIPGVNGFLVASRHDREFAACIRSFRPSDRWRISAETHARNFEWPAIADRLIAHIHRLNAHPHALAI